MMPLDFLALASQCAPQISPITMAAVVRTESGFNPYAIGVVHGRLIRQPSSEAEATATARALEAAGWRYSVGLAQVSRANWSRYGLTARDSFDPCRNLAAGAAILQGCFASARHEYAEPQLALRAGLSCYATGDFSTGYRTGYVQRVMDNARLPIRVSPDAVPAIAPIPVVPLNSDMSRGPIRPKSATDPPRRTGRSDASPVEQGGEHVETAVVF
ncbi:lytic transglycosylase [Trinickia symbiotica]|uniref:Lytic transglycosylase n=2 Tax=Trinickia symbiotica TaxID=863227 RepID=A0A2T3XKK9_9BURK|nr:lytic transglycosylase domain-containing protein [Trinickia symbiotica]PTB16959.1 lytic transglycosylase [Trinickia symbiotica]